MKFTPPQNPNYCATVVEIKNIIPLENCDNVQATNLFGFQAIISKDVTIGTVGVLFTVETQLSEEYCRENNLYRHAEKNKDTTAKGYMEDNGRIRAIKFRGNTSNCLFMPLSSLSYTKINIADLDVGDEFDHIDSQEICKKYQVQVRESNPSSNQKKVSRVESMYMPEHFSTDNYFKNATSIDPSKEIIVTQKLHGTSIRIGNTLVRRTLSLRERIAKWFGVKVQEFEHDYVFGSRKVIKDINNKDQNHFYKEDIWTTEGKKLEGVIPENYIVYAELIGWTPGGGAIQSGYTYNLLPGKCALYVYRVAFVNEKGLITDLSWDQVKEFCIMRDLLHVPEIWRGKHCVFTVEPYMDVSLKDKHTQTVPLSDKSTVDEGVCIRVDGLTPKIYKAKSPKFFEYETALLDKGEVDLESL